MSGKENPPLTDEEFQSLVALAGGADAANVPPDHREKLVELGLLMKKGIEFRVTSAGRLLTMLGR